MSKYIDPNAYTVLNIFQGNEMSTTTTITKMPTKISTPATPTSTTTTITKMPISTSATPTTASTASKIVSSHVVSIIMSTLRTPIATTTTKISTPMPSTSNNTSMITGTANNAPSLFPHFIVIYILVFLICCFIVIAIIFVSKFNVSVKKRLHRLENPIFTRTHSIAQQQLDIIERRLHILENSPFVQTESRNSACMETGNDYLIPLQRLESHANLSWDYCDYNYEPVYNTTTTRL